MAEQITTRCPVCRKRRVAQNDTVCRTCRRFIAAYIDTGLIPNHPVPSVANVLFTMRTLGLDQTRAVLALGGTP